MNDTTASERRELSAISAFNATFDRFTDPKEFEAFSNTAGPKTITLFEALVCVREIRRSVESIEIVADRTRNKDNKNSLKLSIHFAWNFLNKLQGILMEAHDQTLED